MAEAWLFDLDNTLYPCTVDIFGQVERRMTEYVANFLGIGLEDAFALQKQYFREFGTTMRGMMSRHGMDPAPFLDYVHAIDLSCLAANPLLDAALARLPGRKLIFTNASLAHAERVMDRLGVGRHFEAVFDIRDAGWTPKPDPGVYDRLVARHGITATRAVMLEDIARNLMPAAALGMTTVWVRDGVASGEGAVEDHVHFVVDDLVDWLEQVVAAERP